MKKALLTFFCLAWGITAQAQAVLVRLLAVGAAQGVSAARTNRAQKPDASATTVTYRGQSFLQKRTPPDQLRGAAKDQIAYQEELLEECYSFMLADTLAVIATPNKQGTLKASRELINRDRPKWNTSAYEQEAALFEAEDARRARNRPAR